LKHGIETVTRVSYAIWDLGGVCEKTPNPRAFSLSYCEVKSIEQSIIIRKITTGPFPTRSCSLRMLGSSASTLSTMQTSSAPTALATALGVTAALAAMSAALGAITGAITLRAAAAWATMRAGVGTTAGA
jgi:hypothetical protein